MKKQWSMIVFTILFSLILGACSGGNNPNTTISNPEETNKKAPGEGTSPIPTEDIGHSDASESSKYDDLEIITLLPPDAIPAIDSPTFLSAEEADSEYAPDEIVIGVEFNGEARAYSIPLLSSHEIVNDTVGGVKLSVTW